MKNIFNYLHYKFITLRRFDKLPKNKQKEIGRKTYEMIYNDLSTYQKKNKGVCSILFECPYSGHINHIKHFILNKLDNKNDPLSYFDLDHIKENHYILSIGVFSQDENSAMMLADAGCMLSILQSNETKWGVGKLRISLGRDMNFKKATDILKSKLLETSNV